MEGKASTLNDETLAPCGTNFSGGFYFFFGGGSFNIRHKLDLFLVGEPLTKVISSCDAHRLVKRHVYEVSSGNPACNARAFCQDSRTKVRTQCEPGLRNLILVKLIRGIRLGDPC